MRKEEFQPPGMLLHESDEKQLRIVAGPNDYYEAGSEVYMSYGRYSNRQLLCVYGFALQENKYNYARIKVNLDEIANTITQQVYMRSYRLDGTCAFKIKQNQLCTGNLYSDLLRAIRAIR